MARQLTQAARCAQAIRRDLKQQYPSTSFRVTSENYSGGSSVNINWTDGPRQDHVESLLSKYEYGHFDGMQDLYEITNNRDDIPQTKYLFCNREASRERKQAAVDWLNAHTDVACGIGERGEITGSFCQQWNEWPSTIVHRMLSGYYARTNSEMDFSGARVAVSTGAAA